MSDQIETAVEMVRRLDALEDELRQLEGWQREGRLGRRPGVIRRIGFLPGRFAGGWFGSDKFEELPRHIYRLFFETLRARQVELAEEMRRLTTDLEALR